jgi:exopolysaccharide biosynthesis polyprenyl glycosylphosphotransferase
MAKVWWYSIGSIFSLAVVLAARHAGEQATTPLVGESLGLLIILLSCQICFHLNGVDELLVDSKPQILLQRVLKAFGAGLIIASGLFYIFPRLSPGYAAAAGSACMLMFSLVVLRPVARSFSLRNSDDTTLIVGSNEMALKLYENLALNEQPERLRVVTHADLERFRSEPGISRIVIADPEIHGGADTVHVLMDLKLRGVKIESATDSLERTARMIWIEGLSAENLVLTNGFRLSKFYLACKRALDILFSLGLLAVMGPLMALIAVLIKLDTPGPAIFKQERVGLRGSRFTVFKFRSMRQDAEKHSGPTWAAKDDNRVTPIGGFLRKCRLDELPQVFNVLRGDMSFVGPRPERPYFVDLLKEKIKYYDVRHYVKPGITGWAQVMYPYGASVEDAYHKLQYDLYYAKKVSIAFDFLVLFKTIKIVLTGQGR